MKLAVPLLALLSSVPGPAPAQEQAAAQTSSRFVIIQPGYPGSTEDAAGFVGRLAKHLEAKAGISGASGVYYNEEAPALEACRAPGAAAPGFGVVSLGFYLKHRQTLGLVPLLQSKPKDNFVLVARPGDVKNLDALQGQPVAGGPLHEVEFLGRIALEGKADPSVWERKPTLSASRALRDLVDRKKHRAVILTGRDYRAFLELYRAKGLEKVWESAYYPPAFLVAFQGKGVTPSPEAGQASPRSGEPPVSKEVENVKRAFAGLPEDPRGKEILETMAAEGFEEVSRDWLKEVEGKYDAKQDASAGGERGG